MFLLFISWLLSVIPFGLLAPPSGPCDKSRKVLNDTWGIISDGSVFTNYTEDSHCEWLIKAKNHEQFITLKFNTLWTECSYDYVFVFDGDSYKSPLLGSFSGKNSPVPITATSGSMLILLYSDPNYALEGFSAEYSVSNCPANCSSHGMCIHHTCVCDNEWTGDDCAKEMCPANCGGPTRGHCIHSIGQCVCNYGYAGQSCSLASATDAVGNRWHKLYTGGMTGRVAHSTVYLAEMDSLFVYGGFNLNSVLDDLVVFKFNDSHWYDERNNIIQRSSSALDLLDSPALRNVLSKAGPEDARWGVKSRTYFQNILISYVSNSTFRERHSNDMKGNKPEIESDEHTTPSKPPRRFGHAYSRYKNGFVIYGGKLGLAGELSNELWYYDAIKKRWSLKAFQSNSYPPPLVFATLTLVNDSALYLVGGTTPEGEFSSKVFTITLTIAGGAEQWRELTPHGGKEADFRVSAHSTVYDPYSGNLVIFGGFLANEAQFSKLSDRIFTFQISARHWTEIKYPRAEVRDSYVPRERAFHTANVLGNYMVIFGGYTHRHNREEICYDYQLYLYHMGCHTWISHDVLGPIAEGGRYPKSQGMFAHGADIRNDNSLLVVGGYHGTVNVDLLAYSFPPNLIVPKGNESSESMCYRHDSLFECTSDPECGWCSSDDTCYGRSGGINCTTNLQTTRCPGVCPTLIDCYSCLAQSEAQHRETALSIAHRLHLGQCMWCVQNSRCHHKMENGFCGLEEDTPSQNPGWWGAKGIELTNISECSRITTRPGLTSATYFHPINMTVPDSVAPVNSTTLDIAGLVTGVEGQMLMRLSGYLRLPPSWNHTLDKLKICASYCDAFINISHHDALIAASNLSANIFECKEVEGLEGIFDDDKLAVVFEAHKMVSTFRNGPFVPHSKMELHHNKYLDHFKPFTFEYLQPRDSNASCVEYNNCLQCMTDAHCGWCDLKAICVERGVDERSLCSLPAAGEEELMAKDNETRIYDNWRYLVTFPTKCTNCSNMISCRSCVATDTCEWWAEDARCERRGRLLGAITNATQCPESCHTRKSCRQCMETGRCVWCQSTQECFAFSLYTSQYQFGGCKAWIGKPNHPGVSTSLDPNTQDELTHPDLCDVCAYAKCSDCLKSLTCGWCYNRENPIIGTCVSGDFSGPYGTTCAALFTNTSDVISAHDAKWDYAQCPDVDECGLGLHDCHVDAKCTNTHGSYSCQCRRGYEGDGKTRCDKTCFHKCVHGYCIGSPHYVCQCDVGWTGVDCSLNCGCNNHSTCATGIGKCDQCQDYTTGEFCQHCRKGSYGNATTSEGCKPCACNGHGDPDLGLCDPKTGHCFCTKFTYGRNCEKCKAGFFGDPRNGGMCLHQCIARGVLMASGPEGFGSKMVERVDMEESRKVDPPFRECLWIIQPKSVQPANVTEPVRNVIQVTIDKDMRVPCGKNSVYMYDGMPDYVSSTRYSSPQSHLLGVYCSQDATYPLTVEATSGVMTVHYKQSDPSEGFNATYKVLQCDNCPPERQCKNGQCVCKSGTNGINCEDVICLNNCSAHLNRGYCDTEYGRCICLDGFGGQDCSTALKSSQLVFTELFNAAHISDSVEHLRSMLHRFGHSVLTDRRGQLWLFGGFSLSHGPLNDIRLFDTKNNTWMQVTVDSTNDASMPQGRYFHAAEISFTSREIFVYGGLTSKELSHNNSRTLKDFWKFNLKSHRWIDVHSKLSPPPLAGHTLTLYHNGDVEILVLIGGFSPEFGFLEDMWEFDTHKGAWDKVESFGVKPLGVYGHSTVYHERTQSMYVFGGYLYSTRNTYMSDKLYAFNYPSRAWSLIPSFDRYNPNIPRARFLHTAVATDTYMVVFGGRTEIFPEPNATLIAYSYKCNKWVQLLSKDIEIVGESHPPTYAHAMTMDADSGAIYILGGFAGHSISRVTRIKMPPDLCSLYVPVRCRAYLSCFECVYLNEEERHCFSNFKDFSHPTCIGTRSEEESDVICEENDLQNRNCEQFTTCAQCLTKLPIYWNFRQHCHWCSNCGTGRGKCVSEFDGCGPVCRTITDSSYCPEAHCAATDCEQCTAIGNCMWTRQVSLLETGVTVSGEASYEWNCVPVDIKTRSSIPLKLNAVCPTRCYQHKDCNACLTSQGGEGGWHECHWSASLNECFSPSYQPLYCAGGVCGLVLSSGEQNNCPQACSTYTRCSTCLRNTRCGWCSLQNGNATGEGVCTEASFETGPAESTCEILYREQSRKSETPSTHIEIVKEETQLIAINATFSWHYVSCPPENECANGHHTCDAVSEQCVDLQDGFECVCGPGYTSSARAYPYDQCVPVCSQGCDRGVCVQPDKCHCDFGYVGANCSTPCQCNGHANCAGPDKLDQCSDCRNNTKGAQCEKCKPLFVGDARNNGVCVPCSEYCNGHAYVCVSGNITSLPFTLEDMSRSDLEEFLKEGPVSKAHCLSCKNNTTGFKCEGCVNGFFRGVDDHREACRPCECHGHGDTCDPVTGEKCNCQNNTESDPKCHANPSENRFCWDQQCSKCRDTFVGNPVHGHQCYKHMTTDHKFCLDTSHIDECLVKHRPLYTGQASFFAMSPRFMNVDIRCMVDVSKGAVDVYITTREDMFVVTKNTTISPVHTFSLDSKFHWYQETFFTEDRTVVHSGNSYQVQEHEVQGLTTFVTITNKNSVTIVKNVSDRLIMILPHDRHDLTATKFYVAIIAVGAEPTHGLLQFRQDQLHIDLFVFFSVFFSFFFLFLAACVVGWKAKQAAEIRRARRAQAVEMSHLARRPYAHITMILQPVQVTPHHRRKYRSRISSEIRPVGVEPTSDLSAAITTILVTLPGAMDNGPAKLAFATTLSQLPRSYINSRGFFRHRISL